MASRVKFSPNADGNVSYVCPGSTLCTSVYCHQHTTNVMLKSIICIGNDISCRSCPRGRQNLRFQAFLASISTNTAINKSLRRSQYKDIRTGRQPSRRPTDDERNVYDRPYTGQRTRRPNHQQGQDVQDIEQQTDINERYRALKETRTTRRIPRGLKTLAQESVAKGLSMGETLREARYDYTRKAGGNRATRRAAQFSPNIERSSEAADYTASNAPAGHRQSSRGNKTVNPPGREPFGSSTLQDEIDEGDGELSLPEDLRDEHPPRSSVRSFTTGRQAPDAMGIPGSIGSRSYGRDFPQSNDQITRYRESDAPMSIPYTTPASEFLYGTSVVIAALLSSRRKFYKLYIYDGDNREIRNQDTQVRRLALDRNVDVQRVKGDWLRTMDKMSAGRPHNVRIQSLSRDM